MFPNGRYWEITIPDQEINYRLKLTYHMHRSKEKQGCLLTAPVTWGCLLSLFANKRNILSHLAIIPSFIKFFITIKKPLSLLSCANVLKFAWYITMVDIRMVISRKSFLWHLSKMIHRSHHSLLLTIVLHCTCKNFDFRLACISTTT